MSLDRSLLSRQLWQWCQTAGFSRNVKSELFTEFVALFHYKYGFLLVLLYFQLTVGFSTMLTQKFQGLSNSVQDALCSEQVPLMPAFRNSLQYRSTWRACFTICFYLLEETNTVGRKLLTWKRMGQKIILILAR